MIRCENLEKTYGSVNVLSDFNLSLPRGAFCALVGPSGGGKTTLLNILGALDRPTAGRVVLDGTDLTACPEKALYRVRRDKVGFVFQLYHLIPALKAWENVLVPAVPWGSAGLKERAGSLLSMVGLAGKEDRRPGQLSGGEQQRVAVARALLLDPPIILADEPTGNLDRASGRKVMQLLRRLNQELGKTILVATHDPGVAGGCQSVIELGQ
ncbi:MAG: ABC transporter ATP-binding protein [Peptococcaceae bacterium]|nr:ABC transporter ATP-binding protein [Peptococcaceae bacterium]